MSATTRNMPVTMAVCIATAILLSGCTQTRSSTVGTTEPTQSATPNGTATAEPTTTASEPVPLTRLVLGLEPVADGFDQPLFVTGAGDGSSRLFVVEQTGRVRVIRDGAVQNDAFLDVSKLISTGGERGLLGLAFAPGYSDSGRFYVNYTDRNGDTIVARYTADDPASDAPTFGKPVRILRVQQPYANHNGGCIAFGPDGYLYIGMGDGGSGGDPENRAQDPSVLLGKMLRIEVEGHGRSTTAPGGAYGIPVDNPKIGGKTSEVWALGLRNPWRFSFDKRNESLWIGDVGQNAWEEVDVQIPGSKGAENYGWNRFEGRHTYPGGEEVMPPRDPAYVFPIFEYGHDVGNSVTGGYVYRGTTYPALSGTYVFGDFGSGRIWGIQASGPELYGRRAPDVGTLLDSGLAISSFGEDDEAELYVCDYGGSIYRITASAK